MKSSEDSRLCPYRTDWPWQIMVPAATVLGIILEKITLGVIKRGPSPLLIGLTIFLAFDLVLIVATAIQGTLLPQLDKEMQLIEDFMAPVIAILFPLAVAIAFRFCERLYSTFKDLGRQNVISGTPDKLDKFITGIDRKFNSFALNAICIGMSLVAFSVWVWGPELIGFEKGFGSDWVNKLPFGVKIYAGIWVILAWFLIVSLTLKAIILWNAIRDLSTERLLAAIGIRFSIDLHHPDGCGGFSRLSRLWLNVNYLVVITGIYIFGVVAQWKPWKEPLTWVGVIGYIFFGPLLFFGPFLHLHSLMVEAKEKELDKCILEWERVKAEGTEAEIERKRELYEKAKNLPTWPFNIEIRKQFWKTYLLPFILPIYHLVLELVLPKK